MRVALVLSGQPRFFKKSYIHIYENLIKPNNIEDIFFHTWFSYEDIGKPQTGASWTQYDSDTFEENIPEKLIELYNPKYFTIESQRKNLSLLNIPWDEYPKTNGENLAFVSHSMFYSMYEAMELCAKYEQANNFEYDIVVRVRFDAGILSPIELSKYEITKNTKEIMYADVCRNKEVISDWVFWSNTKNMRYLCNVYNYIDKYVFNENVLLCGENLLTYHLNRIGCVKSPKPISLFLIRDKEFKDKSNFGRFW